MESKKKKSVIIIAIVVLLILAIGLLLCFFYPKYKTGKEIKSLLNPLFTEANQSMDVDVEAVIDEKTFDLDADVYLLQLEEMDYLVIEQNDHPIYVVDGVLYLENGKAYKLVNIAKENGTDAVDAASTEIDESMEIADDDIEESSYGIKEVFAAISSLLESVDVVNTEDNNEVIYSVSITGDQAQSLLSSLYPTSGTNLEEIETIELKVTSQDQTLEAIEITGSANVKNKIVSIDISFSDFQVLQEDSYVIPNEIQSAVASVDKDTLFCITQDLFRLIKAFQELSSQEEIEGTVKLYAVCGWINFNKEYDLSKLEKENTQSSSQYDPTSSTLHNDSSKSEASEFSEVVNIPELVELLCLEGNISCSETENGYLYNMNLEEDAMQQLAEMIVPEIVNEMVTFTNGEVLITIEDGTITSMDIEIDGAIKVLLSEIAANIGAEFTFLK